MAALVLKQTQSFQNGLNQVHATSFRIFYVDFVFSTFFFHPLNPVFIYLFCRLIVRILVHMKGFASPLVYPGFEQVR